MPATEMCFDGTWSGWRGAARTALAANLQPVSLRWRPESDSQESLFDVGRGVPASVAVQDTSNVPRAFLTLGADVACHRDPTKWDVLYRVLWRLTHGERHLLDVFVDDDVHRLQMMNKAVHREGHKLRAFVRFRRVGEGTARERYVAWFEPEHDVVAREASFFVRRFPSMHWSILTPTVAAHWDCAALRFSAGVTRSDSAQGDPLEDLWRTYYASIFNPARVKPKMMRSEMPVRYWKHLPEAALIRPLLRDAPGRVSRMIDRSEERAVSGAPEPPIRRAQSDVPRLDQEVARARDRTRPAR